MCDALEEFRARAKVKARILCFAEFAQKMFDLNINEDIVYQVTGIKKEDLNL